MASRHAHTHAAVGPTLTGLSLAAALTHEAADAVPFVKQALGVVVRILELAEKIDKDREALHALAEKSVQLAQRLRDVMGNDEPHLTLLPSLERMYMAVQDVEAFMAKHVARNWFTRGFSYAFTINRHVDRLSRSLENAFQEIVTVTLLAIEQDAQYDGEFRLIRHCQVDKLELIREDKDEGEGGVLVVKYHIAQVDGKLLVVRCCEGSGVQDTHAPHPSEKTLYDRVASCDTILKELSTVQRSHPNVARIYGWSKGSIHTRFTVFRSGFRDMDSALRESPNPIATLVRWTFKLLDAVHHLKLMAISWAPCGPAFALDDRLEPTIGLQNDLRRIDPESEPLNKLELQIYWILDPLRLNLQLKEMTPADARAAVTGYHYDRLSKLLGRYETIGGHRHVIPKLEFSHGHLLNDGIAEGLLQLMEAGAAETAWEVDSWIWANILLALDKSRGHRLRKGLKFLRTVVNNESDSVEVFAVDEDPENIVYDRYRLDLRCDDWAEVREILGIALLTEDPSHEPYLIPVGGPSAPE